MEVKDDADKAAAASKLSVTDVLMKANAILNKVRRIYHAVETYYLLGNRNA